MKNLFKAFVNISLILSMMISVTGCKRETGKSQPQKAPDTKTSTQQAKEYKLPDGNINIIIPVAAGGGTDSTFRALAEAAKTHINRNVVVVNITGAGGSVGLAQAATKEANGLNVNSYTSEIFTLPVFQQTSFSGKDFKPILMVNEDPACIVVPAKSPYKTLEEFISAAKGTPGKISVGNSGFGNIWHLSASAFAKKAGIDIKQVPFEGAAPTLQAALGGHIDAFVASPPEVASQVEAGELKILAVMADKRVEKFPDVPTLKEKGIDLSIGTWRALGVPSKTPDEAVKALHDAFAKGMEEESFKSFMKSRGLGIRYMDTEQVTKFAEAQRPMFEELAKEISKTKK